MFGVRLLQVIVLCTAAFEVNAFSVFLFVCRNGHEIGTGWRCNGKDDCGDDSDEENCPGQATTLNHVTTPRPLPAVTTKQPSADNCTSSTHAQCSNGVGCVPWTRICDGTTPAICADGSDQSRCVAIVHVNRTGIYCDSRHFWCPYGTMLAGHTGQCKPNLWLHDGHADCPHPITGVAYDEDPANFPISAPSSGPSSAVTQPKATPPAPSNSAMPSAATTAHKVSANTRAEATTGTPTATTLSHHAASATLASKKPTGSSPAATVHQSLRSVSTNKAPTSMTRSTTTTTTTTTTPTQPAKTAATSSDEPATVTPTQNTTNHTRTTAARAAVTTTLTSTATTGQSVQTTPASTLPATKGPSATTTQKSQTNTATAGPTTISPTSGDLTSRAATKSPEPTTVIQAATTAQKKTTTRAEPTTFAPTATTAQNVLATATNQEPIPSLPAAGTHQTTATRAATANPDSGSEPTTRVPASATGKPTRAATASQEPATSASAATTEQNTWTATANTEPTSRTSRAATRIWPTSTEKPQSLTETLPAVPFTIAPNVHVGASGKKRKSPVVTGAVLGTLLPVALLVLGGLYIKKVRSLKVPFEPM